MRPLMPPSGAGAPAGDAGRSVGVTAMVATDFAPQTARPCRCKRACAGQGWPRNAIAEQRYARPRAANAARTARWALVPYRPAVVMVAAAAAGIASSGAKSNCARMMIGRPASRRAPRGCPTAPATRSRRPRGPRPRRPPGSPSCRRGGAGSAGSSSCTRSSPSRRRTASSAVGAKCSRHRHGEVVAEALADGAGVGLVPKPGTWSSCTEWPYSWSMTSASSASSTPPLPSVIVSLPVPSR